MKLNLASHHILWWSLKYQEIVLWNFIGSSFTKSKKVGLEVFQVLLDLFSLMSIVTISLIEQLKQTYFYLWLPTRILETIQTKYDKVVTVWNVWQFSNSHWNSYIYIRQILAYCNIPFYFNETLLLKTLPFRSGWK